MPKYLVVSYDNDAQVGYYDWVIAKDENEAMLQIDSLRDDSIAVGAMTADKLLTMAAELEAATPKQIAASLRDIAINYELMDDNAWQPITSRPARGWWHITQDGLIFTSEND